MYNQGSKLVWTKMKRPKTVLAFLASSWKGKHATGKKAKQKSGNNTVKNICFKPFASKVIMVPNSDSTNLLF